MVDPHRKDSLNGSFGPLTSQEILSLTLSLVNCTWLPDKSLPLNLFLTKIMPNASVPYLYKTTQTLNTRPQQMRSQKTVKHLRWSVLGK